MHLPFLFLFPLLIHFYSPHVAADFLSQNNLAQGSSLFVEKKHQLVSPNRKFTAGFHEIGQNAYCFAIWFSELMHDGNHTFTWMANRDEPVNGKRSKFSLGKNGNLVLRDAGRLIWETNTKSTSPCHLKLLDSGNLILTEFGNPQNLWESFSFPTDTILPNQIFTKDTFLISSRSLTNFSSGFYRLYFDNDNVIRLLYNNNEITSVYWPRPWVLTWDAGRSTYNNSRSASLDSNGRFLSSDSLNFSTTDYGNETIQRRLTLDVDGNIRIYSYCNEKLRWIVSWQSISITCSIHGICGPNSLCTYRLGQEKICTCMHGYKAKNHSDLSLGCAPTFNFTQPREFYDFIRLPYVEFYGFDSTYIKKFKF